MTWEFIRENAAGRRIRQLAEPVCEACGVDLYLVEVVGGTRRSTVRVTIDALDGVSIEDCAHVSRQLSAVLDVEDPLAVSYNLEVSSPGLNRRLRGLEDVRAVIGSKVQVETAAPVDGRRRFNGKLLAVDDRELLVDVDGQTYRVPADAVRRANLVYEFEPQGSK